MSSDDQVLRDPARIASPSIRGYYYQFLRSVECWIALKEEEVMWCEGNEDIDVHLADQSKIEHQIKHLAGNVTEATVHVRSSVLNFLKGFVHQRKSAQRVRFIFRTTANLGRTNEPALEAWLLGDASNLDGLSSALTELVRAHGDDEARLALATLRSRGWMQEFLSSVEWTFGASDYLEMRAALTRTLGSDPRCKGLDAELLTGQVIDRVARASCAKDLNNRVLTAMAFSLLVNDTLIRKLCTRGETPAQDGEGTYLATGRGATGVCAIVVRFPHRTAALEQLEQAVSMARTHPGYAEQDETSHDFDAATIRDALRKVDCDVFGAWHAGAIVEDLRQSARECVQFCLRLSKVRAESARLLYAAEPPLIGELPQLQGFELECVKSDVCSQFAQQIAEWVVTRNNNLGQLTRKIRCFADLSSGTYFTQENVLVLSRLSLPSS